MGVVCFPKMRKPYSTRNRQPTIQSKQALRDELNELMKAYQGKIEVGHRALSGIAPPRAIEPQPKHKWRGNKYTRLKRRKDLENGNC
jgi:hypothetical protein